MNDEEIINEINEILVYLEDEGEYHLDKDCDTEWLLAVKEVLNFFNRQQAEIERLKYLLEREEKATESFSKQCYKDGIKEFAERLKKEAVTKCDWDNCVDVEDIDRLVAEMVGEQNV